MRYYLAPLEGITGYIFRNAHTRLFTPADKYFSPFLVPKPNSGKQFSAKEKADILPEHNQNIHLVPQIMTNKAADFIAMTKALEEYGYQEVNLNLGCPSRTVVTKGRGAGFLSDPETLQFFFDEVFREIKIKISVKTRIGLEDAEEFQDLLSVYNQLSFTLPAGLKSSSFAKIFAPVCSSASIFVTSRRGVCPTRSVIVR